MGTLKFFRLSWNAGVQIAFLFPKGPKHETPIARPRTASCARVGTGTFRAGDPRSGAVGAKWKRARGSPQRALRTDRTVRLCPGRELRPVAGCYANSSVVLWIGAPRGLSVLGGSRLWITAVLKAVIFDIDGTLIDS